MQDGMLLVVDYAMEASRYYAARRPDGTLTAYRQQQASGDVLRMPVNRTSRHICASKPFWTLRRQRAGRRRDSVGRERLCWR